MKKINILALSLLIVGGLNWGLWGFFQFDLVAALFGGNATVLSRLVYGIVGLSAVFLAFRLKSFAVRTAAAAIVGLTLAGMSVTPAVAGGHEKGLKHDIIETATSDTNFTTLATALEKADLIETLRGKGPFTVFAPTDEAFAKIPADQMKKLLENPDELRRILLYHVVAGKVMAGDVIKLQDVATVEGSRAKISVVKEKVMVDGASVVSSDIEANNGVIHVIDRVILPPAKEGGKTSSH